MKGGRKREKHILTRNPLQLSHTTWQVCIHFMNYNFPTSYFSYTLPKYVSTDYLVYFISNTDMTLVLSSLDLVESINFIYMSVLSVRF